MVSKPLAPFVMVQGTGSHVGKSQIVAGLCRYWANRGIKVAPFKPQNMANNAMVAEDGGEVGRAQAWQAEACRLPLSHHFNPILLKPEGDGISQLIIHGQFHRRVRAREYYGLKPFLLQKIAQSWQVLREKYDYIIVEGAGSPAEVNLRDGDVANMGFAEQYNIPVALAVDIERGGAIAAVVGTHAVLSPSDRARVRGFIINKFRGDSSLFDSALELLANRTSWQSLGIVPYFQQLGLLLDEDSLSIKAETSKRADGKRIHIVVPILPHIANFDDMAPFKALPDVQLTLWEHGALPLDCDLLLLLGSKSTIKDWEYLQSVGWHHDIIAFARRGGRVMGLCGGMQMMGRMIIDSAGLEGIKGHTVAGLGLIPMITHLGETKILRKAQGVEGLFGETVDYYEIHLGQSHIIGSYQGFMGTQGYISPNKRIISSYCHQIFHNSGFLAKFCQFLGGSAQNSDDFHEMSERILNQWSEGLAPQAQKIAEWHADEY